MMQLTDDLRRRMREEHQTLRQIEEELVDRCEEFCADPVQSRLDEIQRLFGGFSKSMRHHFEFEEADGYLNNVLNRRPHHSQKVSGLLEEHKKLDALITEVESELKPSILTDRACMKRFKKSFLQLMADFDRHEIAERELVMEVFWLEGGFAT